MRIHKKIMLLFFCIFSFLPLYSQGEANYWYFGQYAGMCFNTTDSEPFALTNGQLLSYENCTTISDRNGNLLLYSNGINTWNKNHSIINIRPIYFGDVSITQCLLAPKPSNENIYFLFIPGVNDVDILRESLSYFEIDLNLNNYKGGFTEKYHQVLLDKSTEKVAGVGHKNNKDIWILAHEWETNRFFSYLITQDGVNNNPVISSVGSKHIGGISNSNYNKVGYMKISPDGTKVALAMRTGIIEILDFDNSTGLLSNSITYIIDSSNVMYGIEFSPNSRLVYFTIVTRYNQPFHSQLYQVNLAAGDSLDIINSITLIETLGQEVFTSLQLAPNGKIYANMHGGNDGDTIAVINHPNLIGKNCNFQKNGLYLKSFKDYHGDIHGSGALGLPGFISSYFKDGIQVWMPDTSSQAGTANFCIPLCAKLKLDTTISDSRNYSITISFAADLFNPYDNSKISQNYISEGRRYLIIEGKDIFYPYTTIKIIDICGTVLLGDSLMTDLKIEDINITGIIAEPDKLDGSLKINNFCGSKFRSIKSFIPITFNLSPNPVNDFIEIKQVGNDLYPFIEIYNILGLKIINKSVFNKNEVVDVSGLSQGVYFVRIGNMVKKFVKM